MKVATARALAAALNAADITLGDNRADAAIKGFGFPGFDAAVNARHDELVAKLVAQGIELGRARRAGDDPRQIGATTELWLRGDAGRITTFGFNGHTHTRIYTSKLDRELLLRFGAKEA